MEAKKLDINQICERIPHRYPLLMLDHAEIKDEMHISSVYRLTPEMSVFQGHFPGNPMFPGVYLTEIMAQTAAVLLLDPEEKRGLLPVLSAISKMRYYSPAKPGDTLNICAKIIDRVQEMYSMEAAVQIENRSVAAGELLMILK